MNKRQRCSVGGERDRVHVGAGVRRETGHSGLAFGAMMGLSSSGGLWGCLLPLPLGESFRQGGEPAFEEGIPGRGKKQYGRVGKSRTPGLESGL